MNLQLLSQPIFPNNSCVSPDWMFEDFKKQGGL